MSGQLRTLKKRIRSVESTQKITRAMEMVSAAKLHRFQDMMDKGRAFARGLENLLKRLRQSEKLSATHPFLEAREEKKRGLLLLTSDAGLCGSYNLDLFHSARAFLEKYPNTLTILTVGKFGANLLTRAGYAPARTFVDNRISKIESVIGELRTELNDLYLSGQVDSFYAVYGHFVSKTVYKTAVEKLLPLETIREEEPGFPGSSVEYLFEPDENTIFKRLIPLFFESKVRQIFLEAFVSEQLARMQAMHLATENATEMIDSLVIQRNKVRQAAITTELTEIVSGSQALKR